MHTPSPFRGKSFIPASLSVLYAFRIILYLLLTTSYTLHHIFRSPNPTLARKTWDPPIDMQQLKERVINIKPDNDPVVSMSITLLHALYIMSLLTPTLLSVIFSQASVTWCPTTSWFNAGSGLQCFIIAMTFGGFCVSICIHAALLQTALAPFVIVQKSGAIQSQSLQVQGTARLNKLVPKSWTR